MATRLVESGWADEIAACWRLNAHPVRIISPFIKFRVVARLLKSQTPPLQVITRYNLDDFATGVSDIAALRALLRAGAQVRGIRGLHAKVYVFGDACAVVTSANLTLSALERNYEFGVVSDEAAVVGACQSYFETLWKLGDQDLSADRLDDWEATVACRWAMRPQTAAPPSLGDFGASVPQVPMPPLLPVSVADASQGFVKFLGQGDDRVPLTYSVLDEIESAGCHWALAYPASRRPRSVQDGAVMFIGRLTSNPNDTRIFGRAIGKHHVAGDDDATPEEIAARPWKEFWPRYVRVHGAEFVAGSMQNGISLRELMDELGVDAFLPTQRHAAQGVGNTNPRKAFQQKASVELTLQAIEWLGVRLEAAFQMYGKVSPLQLAALD